VRVPGEGGPPGKHRRVYMNRNPVPRE